MARRISRRDFLGLGLASLLSACTPKSPRMATPIVGMGCGTHPNADQHAVMACVPGSAIAALMGW